MLAMWRNTTRRITVQASPTIKQDPISKTTKAKKGVLEVWLKCKNACLTSSKS
jgi:hypothetical protein